MLHPPTAELSSRHLPDLSDTSFQIPLAANYDDFLLANNDDDDFLRGADDSIVTLAPERVEHEPLTLSQLTPKPKSRSGTAAADVVGRSSPSKALPKSGTETTVPRNETHTTTGQTHMTKHQPTTARTLGRTRPKPTITTDATALTGEGSSRHRQEEPAAVANRPNSPANIVGLPLPNPENRSGIASRAAQPENIRKHGKRTVTEGGISKPLDKLPKSCLTRAITAASRKSEPGRLVDEIVLNAQFSPEEAALQGDPVHRAKDNNSGAFANEKKLMTAYGLFNSEQNDIDRHCPQPPREMHDCPTVAASPAQIRDTGSLTLAELSCRTHNPISIGQVQFPKLSQTVPSKSPMRISKKRNSPDSTSSPKQPHKKGKMNDTAFDAAALRPSSRDNVDAIGSSSTSGSNLRSSGVGRRKSKTEAQAAVRGTRRVLRTVKGKTKHDDSSSQTSLGNSRVGSENIVPHQGNPGVVDMPYTEAPNLNLVRTNPTKPMEFTFRLDTRMEARKVELEKKEVVMLTAGRNRRHNRHQVPDFKALHAAQQAEFLASRKDKNLVQPIPFQLSTDDRARERQRFDEMIKERQKEIERAMEAKRREREAEEEREVKEMRRKAVPKAHEVPEWYSQVPKRIERELDPGPRTR